MVQLTSAPAIPGPPGRRGAPHPNPPGGAASRPEPRRHAAARAPAAGAGGHGRPVGGQQLICEEDTALLRPTGNAGAAHRPNRGCRVLRCGLCRLAALCRHLNEVARRDQQCAELQLGQGWLPFSPGWPCLRNQRRAPSQRLRSSLVGPRGRMEEETASLMPQAHRRGPETRLSGGVRRSGRSSTQRTVNRTLPTSGQLPRLAAGTCATRPTSPHAARQSKPGRVACAACTRWCCGYQRANKMLHHSHMSIA